MIDGFVDKTVVITGASAGVGAACARAFAAAGANLVLAARGVEALEAMVNELRAQTRVIGVPTDVADLAQCDALLAEAQATFGELHVLVNNAGMHQRGALEKIPARAVAQMADVNIRAPMYLSTAALPLMRRAGSGAIVMVGSLAGMSPLAGAATYSGTKAGLRAFAFAIADELRGSGVQVGVVSPGPIDTGFIMDDMDAVEDIVFSQPMSSAEQVAEAVMALARGPRNEIAMPAASGKLSAISYLFPALRRLLRPALYAKGKKNKDKYRQLRARSESFK